MKLLLIEDDNNKIKRISEYVRRLIAGADIVEAKSYQSGLQKLMADSFDIVLLDMSLPTFDITHDEDGFQVDPFAGRHILEEMKRKGVATKTIVITMFETFGEGSNVMSLDELDCELRDKYGSVYLGAIYYNSAEINWKKTLADKLGVLQ